MALASQEISRQQYSLCLSEGSVQCKQQTWLHDGPSATLSQSKPELGFCTSGLVHCSSTQGKRETEAAGQCV